VYKYHTVSGASYHGQQHQKKAGEKNQKSLNHEHRAAEPVGFSPGVLGGKRPRL
jgi:hypothetical protein